MKHATRCLVFCLFTSCLVYADEDGPTIKVSQGGLKGVFKFTRGGRKISSFLGIPYAKPPVGDLRFASPQPPLSWDGIRDATKDGNDCIQINMYNSSLKTVVTGDEDCLYLNVHTPKVDSLSKLPVMLYVHGGGFICGSGISTVYGPEYMLDEDLVLVTINYRLGPLGFLSMEDTVLPGNYGLKDQTAALLWVKDNIKNFGGNPNSVTIFGESAGGASVLYHMMSPLSKGLFHRGIAQSGTPLCPWSTFPPGIHRKMATNLASLVGCPSESTEAMADCLKNIPAYVLIDLLQEFYEWDIDPVVLFVPSTEPDDVEGAFLTTDPWTSKTSLPLMIGFTSGEGAIKAASLSTNREKIDEFNNDYDRLGPLTLMFRYTAKEPVELARIVRKFYFGEEKMSQKTLKQLTDMFTDAWFMHAITETVRRHSGELYYYYFNYRGSNSLCFQFGDQSLYSGICHTDDLMYLFEMKGLLPVRNQSSSDDHFSKKLIKLWSNFATYGKPSTPESDTNWLPVKSSKKEYLHIKNNGFDMKDNLLSTRDKFWQTLPYRNAVQARRKDVKDEF